MAFRRGVCHFTHTETSHRSSEYPDIQRGRALDGTHYQAIISRGSGQTMNTLNCIQVFSVPTAKLSETATEEFHDNTLLSKEPAVMGWLALVLAWTRAAPTLCLFLLWNPGCPLTQASVSSVYNDLGRERVQNSGRARQSHLALMRQITLIVDIFENM